MEMALFIVLACAFSSCIVVVIKKSVENYLQPDFLRINGLTQKDTLYLDYWPSIF